MLTERLNFGELQDFKSASRAEEVHVFRGSGYHVVQRLKTSSAEQFIGWVLVERRRDLHGPFFFF